MAPIAQAERAIRLPEGSGDEKVTEADLSHFLGRMSGWSMERNGSTVFTKVLPDVVEEGYIQDGLGNIEITEGLAPGHRMAVVSTEILVRLRELRAMAAIEQGIYERFAEEGITWSQCQVLQQLPAPAETVGGRLSIDASTVRTHIHDLNSTFEVNSKAELVRASFEAGFLVNPKLTDEEIDALTQLSPRMWQVAERADETYKEISEGLDIKFATTRNHFSEAFRRTGVTTKSELLYLALRAQSPLGRAAIKERFTPRA